MVSPEPEAGTGIGALRFACACASGDRSADDPWVAIPQRGKLNDGTKARILNAIHRQPRTVAQLAQELGLSRAAVHRQVTDLLASDLIQECPAPVGHRTWAVERYYRPNFPVILAGDRQEFLPVLEDLAGAIATAFHNRQEALGAAFERTSLASQGVHIEEVSHYLYTAALRLARERLEAAGELPPWPTHADGSRWVWWAEEPAPQW